MLKRAGTLDEEDDCTNVYYSITALKLLFVCPLHTVHTSAPGTEFLVGHSPRACGVFTPSWPLLKSKSVCVCVCENVNSRSKGRGRDVVANAFAVPIPIAYC